MVNEHSKIEIDNAVTKAFSYKKDGVTLAFALRTDTKNQLVIFEELLVAALEEVREDLKK